MIRKFKTEDTVNVMTIWTKGNFYAHDFIDRDYWLINFNKVKYEYLYKSETYVYTENNEIKGFISIIDKNHIGALFIKKEYIRKGIGTKLINFIQDRYESLSLEVYEKNINAILFYNKMGFKNVKTQLNNETQEKEYVMEWKK